MEVKEQESPEGLFGWVFETNSFADKFFFSF